MFLSIIITFSLSVKAQFEIKGEVFFLQETVQNGDTPYCGQNIVSEKTNRKE